MSAVAIIGSGPAGLAAGRYLKSEGFDPVLFDQASAPGGQWSGDSRFTGVWPSMRTNTSRILTAFSDLPHPDGTPVYPTNQQMTTYFHEYVGVHGLSPHLRLETRVEGVSRAGDGRGWMVNSTGPDGIQRRDAFPYVVIANGRYHKPLLPDVPGLASFTGSAGVIHTARYKHPEQYRGLRVLVAGCAISALEIASDLAMLGADRVVTTNRRQRYVLPKLLAGAPVDHLAFSRSNAIAAEILPEEAVRGALQDFVRRVAGNPAQFGAPRAHDSVADAGISLCQHYLPLVAEGRIEVRPWIAGVDGQRVTFTDGHSETFDAIIFGTGYELDLGFLDPGITSALDADGSHLDLYKFTFHPDLPGLAFLGQFHQVGPYFPVVELQARWVAYAWSGARTMVSERPMRMGIEAYRTRRHLPQLVPMHTTARLFAGEAGVEPELARHRDLARPLLFGPLTPISYRISGRDSLPDAVTRTLADAAAFGVVPSLELLPEQCGQLQALAAASRDFDFAAFVGQVTTRAAQGARLS